jgi:hypothetical protein
MHPQAWLRKQTDIFQDEPSIIRVRDLGVVLEDAILSVPPGRELGPGIRPAPVSALQRGGRGPARTQGARSRQPGLGRRTDRGGGLPKGAQPVLLVVRSEVLGEVVGVEYLVPCRHGLGPGATLLVEHRQFGEGF